MLKNLKLVGLFLIYSLMALSVFALPICIIYLLFADTKSTAEILLFAAAEYVLLYAIFAGTSKLLTNKRTATVTKLLLTALLIGVAVQFISNAPSGCVNTRYIDCD